MKPLQPTGDDSNIREQLGQLTAFIRRALRFWSVMAVTLLLVANAPTAVAIRGKPRKTWSNP